jgi:hypothetical protein
MKKKSTSQSAFFNLRVLIGLFTVLVGVFLALVGFGAFSVQAQQPTVTQSTIYQVLPPGFDCSQIRALGLDRQDNLRAGSIRIACGEAQGGSASLLDTVSHVIQNTLAPEAYGTTDVNLITGADTFSHITQSETFAAANPDNPDQIVVAYNDSRNWPAFTNISGASVSTDGGTTFTRLTTGAGTSPFNNTFGDPVVMYNRESGVWFTVWLDAACGGQGLGGYKSATPWDPNSWTHFCIHTGSSDDRESAWVDNNPASPHYGNMYVSWNNFADGGSLRVRYSTDNGLTWPNERQLAPASPFIRDVQLTGDLGSTGHVYVAGMNEMGGGLTNRANKLYRSTDGGNTWTNTYTGPTFAGPGRTTCPNSYFACMYPDTGGYWRHMGWGQPAALNGIVNYVYASRRTGDPGDVYHIRSTDNGNTFGAPLKLNTDAGTRAQWQPNLSAAADGSLLAVWYDERETANCQKGNPAVPCYRMWARKSTDNGATWLADMEFSDVITPLPGQPDPGIIAEYAGDYDYSYQVGNQHLHPWVDGRVTINNQAQQNAFVDKDPAGGGGGIPCGDLVSFQARCQSNGQAHRIQAQLTLTNTSHSGEQVTITVDGNPNSVTINGNKAKLQINNPALGNHTVELTDPAGCFAPVITNCN